MNFSNAYRKLVNEVDGFMFNIFSKYHLSSIPLAELVSDDERIQILEQGNLSLKQVKKIDLINDQIVLDDGLNFYPYEKVSLEGKCILANQLSKFRR
ncbi:hypothetical protein [Aquella oligotrophica]|nr:hypothetical protein [Aquella oligotrophica]